MSEEVPGRKISRLDNLLVLSTTELNGDEKKKRVDLLSTVLLSLAAVLSATSAYQASRWYSEMSLSLNESTTLRAESAVSDRDANRGTLADMMLFVEWSKEFRNKDSLMMIAIEDRFSETLNTAFSAWLHQSEKGAAGLLPKGTPFSMAEYASPLHEQSVLLTKQSDQAFEKGKIAADHGDNFIFSLVIFSLALFFGAICTKIDAHRLQVILLWAGIIILILGVAIIATLPWNIGF